MKVVGLNCSGDAIDWAIATGTGIGDFTVVRVDKMVIPADRRHRQLAWVHEEISSFLAQASADLIASREAQQGMGGAVGIPRVQIEGAMLASIATSNTELVTFHSATITAALRPHGGEADVVERVPALAAMARSRRLPSLLALCAMLGSGRRL